VLLRVRGLLTGIAVVGTAAIALLQYNGTFTIGSGLFNLRQNNDLLPTLAVNWLREHRPPDHLYNSYGAGGYLLYQLSPQTRVFIDGRLDVYGADVWQDSLDFESGKLPISQFADKYHVNSVLIYIRGIGTNPNHLARRLTAPEWSLVYFDDSYALFVRGSAETSGYVEQYGYRFVHPFDLSLITSPAAATQSGTVRRELQRALKESDNGAKALLIAAVDARQRGDEAAAQKYTDQAREKNPAISIGRPQ
jgi:hypothetical protein